MGDPVPADRSRMLTNYLIEKAVSGVGPISGAEELARSGDLLEDKGAGGQGEDGLGAHQKRRQKGRGVFLADDLQGIGDAAAQDAGIEQRERGGADVGRGGLLEDQHQCSRERAGHQELDERHADAVGAVFRV